MKPADKVAKHSDKHVLFYSKWCPWSMRAIDLLRTNKLPYRAYEIEKITPDLQRLLGHLKAKPDLKMDAGHTTRPIVFHSGHYIGGHDALATSLSK
jgi:glutaredoxin